MANFTIRVELHDAEWTDYETLYVKMDEQKFFDTISDGEKTYKLPPGEYNFRGEVDRSAVLAKAKSAASATGRKYSILVTESAGRNWFKLEEA